MRRPESGRDANPSQALRRRPRSTGRRTALARSKYGAPRRGRARSADATAWPSKILAPRSPSCRPREAEQVGRVLVDLTWRQTRKHQPVFVARPRPGVFVFRVDDATVGTNPDALCHKTSR